MAFGSSTGVRGGWTWRYEHIEFKSKKGRLLWAREACMHVRLICMLRNIHFKYARTNAGLIDDLSYTV